MGQRFVQLENTYTGFDNNTGILHVSQLPPNPAILVPGPAFIFVVVNGVPSVGAQVMIGSGELGAQPTLPIGDLPASAIVKNLGSSNSKSDNSGSLNSPHWIHSAIWAVVIVAAAFGWQW